MPKTRGIHQQIQRGGVCILLSPPPYIEITKYAYSPPLHIRKYVPSPPYIEITKYADILSPPPYIEITKFAYSPPYAADDQCQPYPRVYLRGVRGSKHLPPPEIFRFFFKVKEKG